MKRWLRRLIVVAVVALLLGGLYWQRQVVLVAAARWLDVGDPLPPPAEYAMVLGGGENTRPFVAAALIKLGRAHKALLTRGRSRPDDEESLLPPPQEISARVLVRRGVPAGDVTYIGRDASTTFDEAQALAEFLARTPDARVIVVTNGYHTRRARWIFTRQLGALSGNVTFFSAPTGDFDDTNWWQDEEGFRLVAGEYIKLAGYGLWYGWLGYAVVGMALVGVGWMVVRRVRRRRPAQAAEPRRKGKPKRAGGKDQREAANDEGDDDETQPDFSDIDDLGAQRPARGDPRPGTQSFRDGGGKRQSGRR